MTVPNDGRLAHLVERLIDVEKVTGSIPVSPTEKQGPRSMSPGPMLFWAIQESKGAGPGPHSNGVAEPGSRKIRRDGGGFICDRFLYSCCPPKNPTPRHVLGVVIFLGDTGIERFCGAPVQQNGSQNRGQAERGVTTPSERLTDSCLPRPQKADPKALLWGRCLCEAIQESKAGGGGPRHQTGRRGGVAEILARRRKNYL